MPKDNRLIEEVRRSLRSDARLGTRFHPTQIELAADGALILEAEVEQVALKKLALERAAAVEGVSGIVDRIRVRPASPMGDDEIRVHVRNALLADPNFSAVALSEVESGRTEIIRELVDRSSGKILIDVSHGVVTLTGEVPGLATKRLAGVMAWWVPGSRDVINGLAVEPPEEDGPDRIEEAVRLALEKDPFVNAGQIRVGVLNRTVRLTGMVPSGTEREMAEADAWYVFGVDEVINEIAVGV